MPRVCAKTGLTLLIAIAFGAARPARASEIPRHFGLYLAKTTSSTTSAPTPVTLVASSIEATAHGPVIEVVTTQRFTNTTKHTIEAVYVFPLPAEAAVSAMAIRVGEKTIHAEIAPREQALARHEAAVAAGVVGALFEQERPDVFTQTITGIAAGATVEIELRWDLIASKVDGAWELIVPLVVAPRAAPGTATGRGTVGSGTAPDTDRSSDASRVTPPTRDDGKGVATTFALTLDARASGVTSPSHELAIKSSADATRVTTTDATSARDLIVRWKTKGKPRGWIERDDAAGFVAVTVEAPAKPRGKRKPVRAVIVVDDGGAPGTEAALIGHRLGRELVAALGKQDRYAARGKSGAYDWHRSGARVELDATTRAGRHDLVALIGRLAEAVAAAEGTPEIVLITDGLVADQAAVIAAAKQHAVPVHVIGVGAAPNRSLIAGIAAATGGVARYVDPDDVAATAKLVIGDVAHPADPPVIDWGGLEVTDMIPAVLPRLGAGQAITVFGRTRRARVARARINRDAGFAIEVEDRPAPRLGATSPHGVLARQWARGRLAELIASQAAAADIARVAMTYGLVSPHTAMIAVGEEVVDRAGTRRSIAVPVAMPSGMRWQATYRDPQDGKGKDADGKIAEERPVSGSTPTGGVTIDTTTGKNVPVVPPPARDFESTLDGAGAPDSGGDGDRAEGQNLRQDTDDDEDALAAPRSMDLAGAPSSEVTVRHRRVGGGALRLGLRAGGGVVLGDELRRGMGAVGGRLGLALARGRVEAGVDASFWVVGRDADVAFRSLFSITLPALVGPWLDLNLGAGLHLADDSGFAYGAGLRFGRGRLTPTLRWDGALLRGADDKLHSVGAANLGLELDF
jgi:Ca-activated chloride channel family protein